MREFSDQVHTTQAKSKLTIPCTSTVGELSENFMVVTKMQETLLQTLTESSLGAFSFSPPLKCSLEVG